MNPARRTLLAAGTAAALLPALPAPAAAAGRSADPGTGTPAGAVPPYASYWYPDALPDGTPGPGITWRSLKDWRAADDPDLALNASTVPLAPRFTPAAANATARDGEARIQALVSFAPTAANPSQGSATADYYALTHWAYLDELVFWGGSSGEGLVLAPNAPIVDAAHRHGVRVLGNVFLPPTVYGGRLSWTRDLVQRDAAGRYPLAAQLVEVATAYGFDGWFVNAETGGGNAALGAAVLGFVAELRTLAAARGQRVTWYDAMTVNGTVSWQGGLTAANEPFFAAADDMFVDFRWTAGRLASSGQRAEQLGRSRYALLAGVDVESNGWNTRVDWDAMVPADAPDVVSVGFYRPEWTRNHLPDDARAPEDFHAADDRFWTGRSLDPTRPDPADPWRAPAAVVADRSTVTRLPFASVFNTGHGLRWYERGQVTSDRPWNHLGLQDRLPSRRWAVHTDGTRPAVAFDFADAWQGGSSVLVTGELDAPVVLDLYATRLGLTADTVAEVTYRLDAGSAGVELAAAAREPQPGPAAPPYTFLPVPPPAGRLRPARDTAQAEHPDAGSPPGPRGAAAAHPRPVNGWHTATVPLRDLARTGGTLHALGVRLTPAPGSGPVRWRLGRIAVRSAPPARPAAPRCFRVTAATGGDLRLAWNPAPGGVRHHTLDRLLPDGTRRHLGGTCQSAFFVEGLTPEQGERAARFELRAVGELYTSSAPATVTHTW